MTIERSMHLDVRFSTAGGIGFALLLVLVMNLCATEAEQTVAQPAPYRSGSLSFRAFANGDETYYTGINRILRSDEQSFPEQQKRWRWVLSREAIERRRTLVKRSLAKPVRGRRTRRDTRPPMATEAPMATNPVPRPDANAADTKLNLSCHRIERFYSSFVPNITELDLSCNRIAFADQVRFEHLAHLNSIDLAGNNLRSVGPTLFRNTTHLRRVNLAGNRLQAIERTDFERLANVETLLLAHNGIQTIAANSFTGLANLQLLDLSFNNIDAAAVRALQGIPALVALSVAFNVHLGWALQEFVASWSLKELDASGTGLCAIPAALAQSVHTLNVSHNHFEIIRCGDMDSYPLLTHLDISFNEISEIEDDALGRLEILTTLFVHDNQLSAVPTSLPSSLSHLYLQNNQIVDIQPNVFAQLDTLETLDLSGNQLTYLPGLPLPRLLALNLRSSGLRGLSQSVVKTSPNLKDLLLEDNPIKCTDLMGIAEWTTACRSETPSDSAEFQQTEGLRAQQQQLRMDGLLQTIKTPMCCGKPFVRPDVKYEPACKKEAVRQPTAKPLTKKSRKAKMEDIWKAMSASNASESNRVENDAQTPFGIDENTENTQSTQNNNALSLITSDEEQQTRARAKGQEKGSDAINNIDGYAASEGMMLLAVQHMQNDESRPLVVVPQRRTAVLSMAKTNGGIHKAIDNNGAQVTITITPVTTTRVSRTNGASTASSADRTTTTAATTVPTSSPNHAINGKSKNMRNDNEGARPKSPLNNNNDHKQRPQPSLLNPTGPSHLLYNKKKLARLDASNAGKRGRRPPTPYAADKKADKFKATNKVGQSKINFDTPKPKGVTAPTRNGRRQSARDEWPYLGVESTTATTTTIADSFVAPSAKMMQRIREPFTTATTTIITTAATLTRRQENVDYRGTTLGAASGPVREERKTDLVDANHQLVAISQLKNIIATSTDTNNDLLAKDSAEHKRNSINLPNTNATPTTDRMRSTASSVASSSQDYVSDAADDKMSAAVVRATASSYNKVQVNVENKPNAAKPPTNKRKCLATAPTDNGCDGGGIDTAANVVATEVESNIYIAEQSLVAEIANGPLSQAIDEGPKSMALNEREDGVSSAAELAQIARNQNGAVIVHSSHRAASMAEAGADAGGSNVKTSTSVVPEQWHDVRATSTHPGLLVVLGVTIGMVVSLALIQVYRCARTPWQRRHPDRGNAGAADEDEPDQYAPTHRDMMPMELLGAASNRSTIQYTEAPIEMW